MTNFYSDHVLIDGQAVAAQYAKAPHSQAITVLLTMPNSDQAKIRVTVDHEQYTEAYNAWYEAWQTRKAEKAAHIANDPEYDLYAFLNTPVERPTPKQLADAVDMIPAAMPAAAAPMDHVTPPILGNGFRIVFNQELSRTQIIFTKFPTKAARELVKEAGFFWSPNNQAWQKKLTNKARRAAEDVAAKLSGIKIA